MAFGRNKVSFSVHIASGYAHSGWLLVIYLRTGGLTSFGPTWSIGIWATHFRFVSAIPSHTRTNIKAQAASDQKTFFSSVRKQLWDHHGAALTSVSDDFVIIGDGVGYPRSTF